MATSTSDFSNTLHRALSERLSGRVVDGEMLAPYATDKSIYEIRPQVAVHPRDLDDILATIAFARDHGISLTPRAGGSGTAGAALGRGIVLAFHKSGPMNRILALDTEAGEPRVSVEPGLLHDHLQRALGKERLFLPADPSSGAISLIGGNIATKASGPHALKHGSIDRYLVNVEFVTIDGEVVDTADDSSLPQRIRVGLRQLREDLLQDAEAVAKLQKRQHMKTASGYNLFAFLRHKRPGPIAAQLLTGSVGTLGVITRATLSAEPVVESKATTLLYFDDLHEAGDAVAHIRSMKVDAIEIMNNRTIGMVRNRRPGVVVPKADCHLLLVEYSGPQRQETITQVHRLLREQGYGLTQKPVTVEGEEEQSEVWKLRKTLLPMVWTYGKDQEAVSLVNDVGVDVPHLADFIRDVEAIFDRLGLDAAIYGHAGSGNLHLRPFFDRAHPNLPKLFAQVAEEIYEAVFRYGGTITAEHGMGRLRAPYLAREWGEPLYGYMRRVKEIFDPTGLLNPEVMFSTRSITEDMKV